MIHITDLRSRIVLLKRRIEEKDNGSFVEHWQEGATVWAHVEPQFGKEILGEEWNPKTPMQAKYKVTFRYRPDSFSRLKWRQQILALLGWPLIDENRQWMVCWAYGIGEDHE